MRKVVVIGAGAAGMMAAISAAKHGAHIQLCWSIKTEWGRRSFPPGTEDAILQILYKRLSVIAVMILSFRGGSSHSLMRKRQWSFSRTSVYMRKTETDISIQTRIRPVRF